MASQNEPSTYKKKKEEKMSLFESQKGLVGFFFPLKNSLFAEVCNHDIKLTQAPIHF